MKLAAGEGGRRETVSLKGDLLNPVSKRFILEELFHLDVLSGRTEGFIDFG